jgi:predicted nucleic acid-binding protein
MGIYYVDTSALVKVYLVEVGTGWIRRIVDPLQGNEVVISKLTLTETFAAVSKRQRLGQLTDPNAILIRKTFAIDYVAQYIKMGVTDEVVETAADLTKRHPLRGYDAVQLATALILHAAQAVNGLPVLTFLSADTVLCDVARDEGLFVDNPNLHP